MMDMISENSTMNLEEQITVLVATRTLTRNLFREMFSTFEDLDDLRKSNLRSAIKLFAMNFSTNLISLVLVIALGLAIEMNLHREIKSAAESLLKVDKKVYRSAIRALGRDSKIIGTNGKDNTEMTEVIAIHLKHVQIMDTENASLLETGSSGSLNKIPYTSVATINQVSYSSYKNFAKRKYGFIFLLSLGLMILVNSPSLLNMMRLLDFYDQSRKEHLYILQPKFGISNDILYCIYPISSDYGNWVYKCWYSRHEVSRFCRKTQILLRAEQAFHGPIPNRRLFDDESLQFGRKDYLSRRET
jgi:hypothetical protein